MFLWFVLQLQTGRLRGAASGFLDFQHGGEGVDLQPSSETGKGKRDQYGTATKKTASGWLPGGSAGGSMPGCSEALLHYLHGSTELWTQDLFYLFYFSAGEKNRFLKMLGNSFYSTPVFRKEAFDRQNRPASLTFCNTSEAIGTAT